MIICSLILMVTDCTVLWCVVYTIYNPVSTVYHYVLFCNATLTVIVQLHHGWDI